MAYAKTAAFVVVASIPLYFQYRSGVTKLTPTDDPQAESTLVKLAFEIRVVTLDHQDCTVVGKQVVETVFRHGERSPLSTRPNDPYPLEDSRFWPDGRGSLTKLGKKNAFLLGKRLRKRYDTILTPHYSKQNFSAVSTRIERTLMSAYLVLAGLFPPANHQKWSDEIDWTPIPVYHNTVFKTNNCFGCPRFKYEALKSSHLIPSETFSDVVKFLNEKTNYKLKNPKNPVKELILLSDSLMLQRSHGYESVEWADEFTDLSSDIMHDMYQSVTVKTDVQKNLSSSLMADYLLHFMEDEVKVSAFSGHDITLYILAGALGYDLKHTPHPTACLMVEFHEGNGEQFVKAFYIKDAAGEMVPVKMSCGEKCSFAAFKKMLLAVKPEDYTALCNDLPEDADSYTNLFLERLIDDFQSGV